MLLLALILAVLFQNYIRVERFEEAKTTNDWGGAPKTLDPKELEDCQKKVKEQQELMDKKDANARDAQQSAKKQCASQQDDMKKDIEERAKNAEEEMKNAQAAQKKAENELASANDKKAQAENKYGECKSQLDSVEPKIQQARECCDKERANTDSCIKEKQEMEKQRNIFAVEAANAKSMAATIVVERDALKRQVAELLRRTMTCNVPRNTT
jgi:chromosome segregation ATPase